jgi:septin family protein
MINFDQNQDQQFNELLNKAFENAQTFEQHKNKNKMEKRIQHETFIGDGFKIEYTLITTTWAGDNETPGATETEIKDVILTNHLNESIKLPWEFIERFQIEDQLFLNIF